MAASSKTSQDIISGSIGTASALSSDLLLSPNSHVPDPKNDLESGDSTARIPYPAKTHLADKQVLTQNAMTLDGRPGSTPPSVYVGSLSRSPRHSVVESIRASQDYPGQSSRISVSQTHLNDLLPAVDHELESYGVEEDRDGFFDASFFKPSIEDKDQLIELAQQTLPAAFQKKHPLSPSSFLPKQWHEVKGVIRRVTRTRAGIKLLKSFSAFFIAYVLCLVPVTGEWLGRYNYIAVLSTIINHPGRTVGSEVDGVILTSFGTAGGLGWGAFALYVSDSSSIAASGYGGVLAAFFAIFMGTIAATRSYFIRSYQLVFCSGIAIIYTCLAETSRSVDWSKLLAYGIPWLVGQALCLLICCVVFPDAGARPLAVALHDAFQCMEEGLEVPRPDSVYCHRRLAWTFVNLSQAHRDLVLDISVTRFHPQDIKELRNLMQAVIRSLLSLKTKTNLFDSSECGENISSGRDAPQHNVKRGSFEQNRRKRSNTEDIVHVVQQALADPAQTLLKLIRESLSRCDAVLLNMSGYRKYLGPPADVSSDIVGALVNLRKSMIEFDQEDDALLDNHLLPPTYSNHPEVVELFLFVNPIRQTASTVEALLVKIMGMQQVRRNWRPYWPSYKFAKGLQRTNAQVRHDRGGITAGFYFSNQRELNEVMTSIQKNSFKPKRRYNYKREDKLAESEYKEEEEVNTGVDSVAKDTFRYKLWTMLHRLQGFETRFALKVVIVTSLLSVPAWLEQSRGWYNTYQSWWAVVTAWIMLHPRIGGNFQDLITRSCMGVFGAAWAGVSYAAGNGNRYVIAAFAAIYMAPMLYRYTQSSHPRSGLVGCFSFTVTSLNILADGGKPSVVTLSWTYGVSFVVGVVSAVVVNWALWPFVARHELRKAISSMLLHSAIIYRGVVAQYIYYEDGSKPGKDVIQRSELLEGRLREGFVRIRQLMALTRHEIRLRAPFDPLPYSALISACESFFEHLVEVRQSSLFFQPNYMSSDKEASDELRPYRRDAVAAILINLYILAGALRGNRKVPYLPSAAAARKRLLERMAEMEMKHPEIRKSPILVPKGAPKRRFAEVYQFAYSQSLTACVEQLEQLEKYTKIICGEFSFDAVDDKASENETHSPSQGKETDTDGRREERKTS